MGFSSSSCKAFALVSWRGHGGCLVSPSQDIPRIHLSIHLSKIPTHSTFHCITLRYVTLCCFSLCYITYIRALVQYGSKYEKMGSKASLASRHRWNPTSKWCVPWWSSRNKVLFRKWISCFNVSTFVTFIQQAAGSRGQLPTIVSEETSCFEVEQWFPANCPSNQSNDSCSMTCEGHWCAACSLACATSPWHKRSLVKCLARFVLLVLWTN